MAIWTLEVDSGFTEFSFPLDEDKLFFLELIDDFESSKTVSQKWRTLYMLRKEPRKYTDFFSVDDTDVIAMSQKAVDSLGKRLGSEVELLPVETDAGKY